MWWIIGVIALLLVVALVVDRRRGRPRRLGTDGDPVRDAGYGESAAWAQNVRRNDGGGVGGAGG